MGAVIPALALACEAPPSGRTEEVAAAPPAPTVDASPVVEKAPNSAPAALEPLGGEWLERIALDGGGSAMISLPLGATEARPLMVAVHGAGDRPEWACGGWRGVTAARSFIVCPQGTPASDGRLFWPSTATLRRTVDAAVAAARARYGRYMLDGPMVYAGFSAGVIYGAGMLRDDGARFPWLMLSEGGYAELGDLSFASRFRASGGRRVLLGCSTGGCVPRMREARKNLEKAGLPVRLNDAGNLGHNLDGRVVESLRKDWGWLVEDAPGW